MDPENYTGCLLGLALGDALGAPYEGGVVERLVWRMIGRTRAGEMRWTDDTQMALDLAESLLVAGGLDADQLARRFAFSYRWSRGYGPGAAKLLKRIRRGEDWRTANRAIYPSGSYGNGGAMRAPVIGLFYAGRESELIDAARLSASITHAHPLGITGAVIMAVATAEVLASAPPMAVMQKVAAHNQEEHFLRKLRVAEEWLCNRREISPRDVVRELGNGIAAVDSCVTALFIGLLFHERPFLEMMGFIRRCGGDVDSIGAMAGALWGAARGCKELPADVLARLEQRDRLEQTAKKLFDKSQFR